MEKSFGNGGKETGVRSCINTPTPLLDFMIGEVLYCHFLWQEKEQWMIATLAPISSKTERLFTQTAVE